MSPELVRKMWNLKNSNFTASHFETLITQPANKRVDSAALHYFVFIERFQLRLSKRSDIQVPAAVMRVGVYKVRVGTGTFSELVLSNSEIRDFKGVGTK